MKRVLGLLVTMATCLGFPFSVSAQHYLGVETDGWDGINTLYLNPANIAGREERVVVNLFSFNLAMDNSLGTLPASSNVTGTLYGNKYNAMFGGKPFSMLAPSGEVRGPGVMFRIDNSSCIALTTGVRAINEFINFDPSLYSVIANPAKQFSAYTGNSRNFSWQAQSWSEIGLSYGTVLSRGENQWNVGITVRYLGGISYISLKGANLDAAYSSPADSIHLMNADVEYSSNVANAGNAMKNGFNLSDIASQFFGAKGGSGVGGDFGISYLFRPARNNTEDPLSGNGYRMRISASVTDFGIITYKGTTDNVLAVKGDGYVTAQGLHDALPDFSDFKKYVATESFAANPSSSDMKMYLPAMAILSVDYQVYQHFYINGTYLANIIDRTYYGNTYYDRAAIIPRYDSRLVGVALPISSGMLAHDLKVGLALRFTGLFVGSDDVMALFSSSQHGFNFYAGGYIPIFKNRVKVIAESSTAAPKTAPAAAKPNPDKKDATDKKPEKKSSKKTDEKPEKVEVE